jgi:hypothetical protein
MPETTWIPQDVEGYGRLDTAEQNSLPDSSFAFPFSRKEPMTNAQHVRNAIARFDQVQGVSDAERELAFANIQKAARYYGIEMRETDWRQLGSRL